MIRRPAFDYCYKGLAPPQKDDVPAVLKDAQRQRGRFGLAVSRATKLQVIACGIKGGKDERKQP